MMNNDPDIIISQSERRWVNIFTFFILVITTFPYLLGYTFQSETWRFTGFLFAVEDGNSYIAKMLSGAAGHWLFFSPYTPYPQNGILAFIPYLLLGKLTAGLGQHDQLVAIFQIYRWLAGWFLIHTTYGVIALFVIDVRLRKTGTAAAILGGGLGWLSLIVMKDRLPLEFYSPESFGFLALLGLPHLALARGLLLKGVHGYLRPPGVDVIQEKRFARRNALWWIALGIVHPLNLVVGGAVVGGHIVVLALIKTLKSDWLREFSWVDWLSLLRRVGWLALAAAPFVFYNAVMAQIDPFMAKWTNQNILMSPPPLDYILAYGLLVPLVVIGFRNLLALPGGRGWLPLVWVLMLPLLVSAPTNLQRRLSEGVWVFLVIVALFGASRLSESPFKWWKYFVGLLYLTPLIFFSGSLAAIQKPGLPLFRPASEIQAFMFLEEEAEPDAVVLAGRGTSNPLPAWAPLRVVVGHGPESLNGKVLNEEVAAFYDIETTEVERQLFIKEMNIQYVFLGPEERLDGDWQPNMAQQYKLIYQQNGYEIYEVIIDTSP